MAVLVTRPLPNEATAEILRQRGFTPHLEPVLIWQPLPFTDGGETYSALIVTSANAIRAIAGHALARRLAALPLFAVGDATAQAARDAGFRAVQSAGGDAVDLLRLIRRACAKRVAEQPLLYLRGEDVSRDVASALAAEGVEVHSLPVYRMAMIGDLSEATRQAFAANEIEAVLHYSQRSARAFVAAVAQSGLSVAALAVPQICLAEGIADVLRQADAPRIRVAQRPDQDSLLQALERALGA